MKLKDELLNNSIYINNSENDGMLYYILSQCSDVIDFNDILCHLEWFASIDIPEYNVFRLFARRGYKFKCDYLHCSSFRIEIIKE